MNLNNFEEYIDEIILDRGYDYFEEERIIGVIEESEHEYLLTIAEAENYRVFVKLNKQGEIIESDCDCPYDFGPICKHQVAAFYQLSDTNIVEDGQRQKSMVDGQVQQSSLSGTLDRLTREELITVIVEQAEKDERFKNALMLKYSIGDAKQELKNCKWLMKSIVRRFQGRRGYIEYDYVFDFCRELDEVLELAENSADPLIAVDIAGMLLIEAVEAFEYADDSSGSIGQLIDASIDTIETIIDDKANNDTHLKTLLFDKIIQLADNHVLDDWEEFRIDLLEIAVGLADIECMRNRLNQKIDIWIERISGVSHQGYYIESLKRISLELINRYGTKEEADAFIKENLDYTSFRDIMIAQFISEKDFQGVIQLALEGEKKDRDLAGLASKWRKIRYSAYKALSWKAEQQQLAKELFLDGNFDFYQELKDLSPGNEEALYQGLKQELKTSKAWQAKALYHKLIDDAGDLDELIEYVRENPGSIQTYAGILKDKFNNEVLEIYRAYVKSAAQRSQNRKDYQVVCGIISQYGKIAGLKNQELIIQELRVTYKRKPAFVDELRKVKWK